MEADSPDIAPLLYAYCYACMNLRRAAKIAGKKPSAAEVRRFKAAEDFLGAAKRAYFEAVENRRPRDERLETLPTTESAKVLSVVPKTAEA